MQTRIHSATLRCKLKRVTWRHHAGICQSLQDDGQLVVFTPQGVRGWGSHSYIHVVQAMIGSQT